MKIVLTTIGRLMTPVSLLRVASRAMQETRPTRSQHLVYHVSFVYGDVVI